MRAELEPGKSIELVEYRETDAALWDDFCCRSTNGTFLHTRRFLSYHGSRYVDRSVLIKGKDGRLLGLFPAAEDPTNNTRIVSHPGITYGGIIEQGKLYGMLSVEVLRALMDFYGRKGYKNITYKAVPWIYHRVPSQDDLYALFRLGGRCVRRDLSATIDIQEPRVLAERRRRGLAKARRANLTLDRTSDALAQFWPILEDNLDRKYSVRPVHTHAEMADLIQRFPDDIEVVVARRGLEPCAGVVLFKASRVIHAQYIAGSDSGYDVGALEFLFDEILNSISKGGQRYFDFGTSNEAAGWVLNTGLYQFKRGFGAGGCVYEHYDLECAQEVDNGLMGSQIGFGDRSGAA